MPRGGFGPRHGGFGGPRMMPPPPHHHHHHHGGCLGCCIPFILTIAVIAGVLLVIF